MSSAERPRWDRAHVSYNEDNDAAIAAALAEEEDEEEEEQVRGGVCVTLHEVMGAVKGS